MSTIGELLKRGQLFEKDSSQPTFRFRLEYLVLGVTGLFILVVLGDHYGVRVPLVRPVLGFIVAVVFPGTLFLRLIGLRPRLQFSWLPYVIGSGLILIMGSWFALDTFSATVGYEHPISPFPLLVSLIALLALLTSVGVRLHGSYYFEASVPSLNDLDTSTLFVALFAPAAILGVSLLNATGEVIPLVGVFVLIATLPVLVSTTDFCKEHLAIVVWIIALAILYHKSLWAAFTFGGHSAVVEVWEVQRWGLDEESLLPNAILMPSLAYVLGLNILTQVKVVLPFIVSFLPVTLFVAFNHYTNVRNAFLGACLFIFAHPFYLQYPSSPRASMPVFFLALLGAVITASDLARIQGRLLGLLFGIGIAVSHYGTSYFVMFAVIGAVLTLKLFEGFDSIRDAIRTRRTVSDGGKSTQDRPFYRSIQIRNGVVIDWIFGLFYTTVVVGWYLNIDGGKRFNDLTSHVVGAYVDLISRSPGQGSTATRLNTDYGSLSIFLSKHLYLVIAALTGIGIAVMFFKRVLGRDIRVPDAFLALSIHLFVLFGGSFILSGEWGGGRPMMIVLSFSAIFAFFGVETVVNTFVSSAKRAAKAVSRAPPDVALRRISNTSGRTAFAVFLSIFLLINSGAMSALAYGDRAPNAVLTEDIDSIYLETDIRTHVWFTDHRAPERAIYGDQVVYNQATDWINGEIAARSERGSYRFKGQNLHTLNETGVEDGYVILVGHNTEDGILAINYIVREPIANYDLERERRNKIYTTGKSEIYSSNRTRMAR